MMKIITFLLFCICQYILTEQALVTIPSNTTVLKGDSTTLYCSTDTTPSDIAWYLNGNGISFGCATPSDTNYVVIEDATTNNCDLVIVSVNSSRAGTYTCTGGSASEANVIMLDAPPSGTQIGDMNQMNTTCSVTYSGPSSPQLSWTPDDVTSTPSLTGNTVTSSITLTTTTGSYQAYTCAVSPPRSTETQYTWTSAQFSYSESNAIAITYNIWTITLAAFGVFLCRTRLMNGYC